MYIWHIEFEERWSYDPKAWQEGRDYNISALDANKAIEKARKLALSPSNNFQDDNNPKVIHKILDVRLVGLERKEELDG